MNCGSTSSARLKYAMRLIGLAHVRIEQLAELGQDLLAIEVGHGDVERARQRGAELLPVARSSDRAGPSAGARRRCSGRAGRSARSRAARTRDGRGRRRTTWRGAGRAGSSAAARSAPGATGSRVWMTSPQRPVACAIRSRYRAVSRSWKSSPSALTSASSACSLSSSCSSNTRAILPEELGPLVRSPSASRGATR